jgi:hypothetical protein
MAENNMASRMDERAVVCEGERVLRGRQQQDDQVDKAKELRASDGVSFPRSAADCPTDVEWRDEARDG